MRTIERARWEPFARNFSKGHDGWGASLVSRERSGVNEVAIDDRPFRGMTVEHHGDDVSLVLMFGDDADEHLAHIVHQPSELALLQSDPEHASLLVALDDGTGCVLELESPFAID